MSQTVVNISGSLPITYVFKDLNKYTYYGFYLRYFGMVATTAKLQHIVSASVDQRTDEDGMFFWLLF